jgi:sugar lactone lactonase YvrE
VKGGNLTGRCQLLGILLLVSYVSANPDGETFLAGDTLRRIDSRGEFTATVLCTGILGVDGLSVDAEGNLFAVSESSGRLYRIDPSGAAEVLIEGLDHPEGLAMDSSGILYITEDIAAGGILEVFPDGSYSRIAEGLSFPEGVALTPDHRLCVTESTAESGALPPFRTSVLMITDSEMSELFSTLYLWSLSDLVVDPDGMIYVCNELSGYPLITQSILRIDPANADWDVFSSGLRACEGICSTPDSFFPLYVVEEDTGDGSGRLSTVDPSGETEVLAEGFRNIEDVAVAGDGRIYVSEDATGIIILLRPCTVP